MAAASVNLPTAVRWLIVGQAVLASVLVGLLGTVPTASSLPTLGLIVGLGFVSAALKIELFARWGRITMAFAITFYALLALGPTAAFAVNAAAALGGLALNRREGGRRFSLVGVPPHRILFNVGNYLLCVAAAELVFERLGGRGAGLDFGRLALPVLASSMAYYLVNTLGVATAIAWTEGRPVVQVWRENFAWAGPGYLASACGAAGAVYLTERLPLTPAALFLVPPLYLIFQSYRVHVARAREEADHMREVNRLNQSIITSLAMAIDAKDRVTHRHIHRVREYALGIARELGVTGPELEAIKIASLLHDIGKLGISERILCKPDKLTPEEFGVIQGHVDLGARILEPVEFPWPVIPIVLTHHERWDGLGYPRGLRAEEIPIGGRIVALADVFDALTSERPYRKAMSRDAALDLIGRGAGSQFDPDVVAVFLRILPGLEDQIRALEAAAPHSASPPWPARDILISNSAPQSREAEPPLPSLPTLAEPAAVYDWVVASARARLPQSTVCIYRLDLDESQLRIVRSEGVMADRWEGALVRVGEGAVGHAVARREIIVNGQALLDLARRVRPGENMELSSSLISPLLAGGECLGAVAVYHTSYDIFHAGHSAEIRSITDTAASMLAAGQCVGELFEASKSLCSVGPGG